MIFFRLFFLFALICYAFAQADWSGDKKQSKWMQYSRERLDRILNRKLNKNIAKNIILFLGDGMGITTVTAGRILKGQLANKNGEEEITVIEDLDHLALAKTYNIDAQTPDSAGAATAFLSGVKTRIDVVGVDGSATDCKTQKQGAEVESILDWSYKAGKSTGVVTTTRITHATPACAYGHAYSRDWETYDNKFAPIFNQGCTDLAYQLVMDNSFINVLFGGGRNKFLRTTDQDYFPNGQYGPRYGQRVDNLNLIDEWNKKMEEQKLSHKFLWNNTEFKSLKPEDYKHVLGLFNYNDMDYEIDRREGLVDEPSLSNMTEKAIKILQKNSDKGFFLLVEGGRIDHAHHGSMAKRSLYDFLAFEEAVAKAKELVNLDETLLIVTADHSHVFTLGGYAVRGNPLFNVNKGQAELSRDKLTYTAILYGNGPGFKNPVRNTNLTNEITTSNNYTQESAVPMSSETHGGEDVAIYASGPMSYLFDGTVEQSHVAHVMAYSACVGPYDNDDCRKTRGVNDGAITSTSTSTLTSPTKSNSISIKSSRFDLTNFGLILFIQIWYLIC